MTSKFTLPEVDDICYCVDYTIHSPFGEIESERYRQNVTGEVKIYSATYDDEGNPQWKKMIGRVEVDKLLIANAVNDHHSLVDLFDVTQLIQDITAEIWDYDRMELKEELLEHYSYDLAGSDILILSRLEMLPDWRGKGLGKYVIRDVFNNFNSGAGLYVLKVFPIQQESYLLGKEKDAFEIAMEYEKLNQDIEGSFYKLLAFYKKIGFDYIPDITEDLVFLNPAHRNDIFDEIRINDFDEDWDGQ